MLWLEKKKRQQAKSINTEHKEQESLENDVVVFVLTEDIRRLFLFRGWGLSSGLWVRCLLFSCPLTGCKNLSVRGSNISLLLSRDLLQAIKLLSVKLIQFGVDV